VEVLDAGRLQDVVGAQRARHDVGDGPDDLPPLVAAQQHVGEPRHVVHAEHPGDHGLAQVALDEQDAVSALGHRDGQVDDGGRLALLGRGARQDDRLDVLVQAGEGEVRPDRAVALRQARLGGEVRDEPRPPLGHLRVNILGILLLEGLLDLLLAHVGDEPQDVDPQQALDLLDGPQRGVEHLDEEGEGDAEDETDEEPRNRLLLDLGRVGRSPGLQGGADDLHGLHALGVGDLRLLELALQHVEDFLVELDLPLEPRELEALLRQHPHLVAGLVDLDLEVPDVLAQLRLEGGHLALHGDDDLFDLPADLRHLRVELRVGLQQGVALEHELDELVVEGLVGGRRVLEVEARLGTQRRRARPVEQAPHLARLLGVGHGLVVGCLQGLQLRDHGGALGVDGDELVLLPVGLGGLLGGLELLPGLDELGLDEALLADGALVRVVDPLLPVDLGDGVGQPHGQPGVLGLDVDVDDPDLLLEVRLHHVPQAQDRRQVFLVGPHLLGGEVCGDHAELLGRLLDDPVAAHDGGLRRQHIRVVPGYRLLVDACAGEHDPLEPHARRGLVERHGLAQQGEQGAEGSRQQERDEDDPAPLLDDAPVFAEIDVVLGHGLATSGSAFWSDRRRCPDTARASAGNREAAPCW